MIKITIQLYPQGINKPETIAEAKIWNDGTGTASSGNYKFWIMSKKRIFRAGRIVKFPRKRKNVWHLLYKILRLSMGAIYENSGDMNYAQRP